MTGRWSDLSDRNRKLIVAGAIGEAILKTAVIIDIRRRPASQIRGSKRMWVIAAVVFNSAGLGSLYISLSGGGGPSNNDGPGRAPLV